jgi:hypothetical protein
MSIPAIWAIRAGDWIALWFAGRSHLPVIVVPMTNDTIYGGQPGFVADFIEFSRIGKPVESVDQRLTNRYFRFKYVCMINPSGPSERMKNVNGLWSNCNR